MGMSRNKGTGNALLGERCGNQQYGRNAWHDTVDTWTPIGVGTEACDHEDSRMNWRQALPYILLSTFESSGASSITSDIPRFPGTRGVEAAQNRRRPPRGRATGAARTLPSVSHSGHHQPMPQTWPASPSPPFEDPL